MLRVVICEDDAVYLEKIHTACRNYFAEHSNFETKIITFDNPFLCLDKLEQIGGCDVALLDICMPGITGIAMAKEILEKDTKTQVMFLTTSDEFAVEAFGVGAIHYIVKPFTQEEFNIGMNRIMRKFEEAPVKSFFVNGEGGAIHKIDVNSILYIESFRNGRSIYTISGTFVETKTTLQKMLEELAKLCPKQFVSPYRGYIVNFEMVSSISKDGIILKNQRMIPIKPDGFRRLRDSYMEYEFGKEN